MFRSTYDLFFQGKKHIHNRYNGHALVRRVHLHSLYIFKISKIWDVQITMNELENLITMTLVYEYSCMELLYKFTCRNICNLMVLNVDEDKYIPYV